MTDYFVDSDMGDDANAGTTSFASGNPKATLFGVSGLFSAITPAAGDRVFLRHDSGGGYTETVTSTISFEAVSGGGHYSIIAVLDTCGDTPTDADIVPSVNHSDSAYFHANANVDIDWDAGQVRFYGCIFEAGNNLNCSGDGHKYFENCRVGEWADDAGGANDLVIGASGAPVAYLELVNSNIKFENAATVNVIQLSRGASMVWRGGKLEVPSTTSTAKIFELVGGAQHLHVEGVDMSEMNTGQDLLEFGAASMEVAPEGAITFVGCIIPDDVDRVAGTRSENFPTSVTFWGCSEETVGTGATKEVEDYLKIDMEGDVEHDLNAARTGGYEGISGSGYSIKMTPAAAGSTEKGFRFLRSAPMYTDYIEGNGSTSFTITVHFVQTHASVAPTDLGDDVVALEVIVPSTDGDVQREVIFSTISRLDSPSTLTLETDGDWTGSSMLGAESAQSVSVSFTPDYAGVAQVRLLYAPESTDPIWVDPLPVVT